MGMFNPEMMKNLMGNEEIQKMMNDPNIMGNLQNMMGNNDLFKNMGDGACPDGACPDINIDNLEDITIEESRINVGDKVLTQNLKNGDYNDKKGIVEDMLENGRFVIKFDDDRVVAIKEENLVNRFENIENID